MTFRPNGKDFCRFFLRGNLNLIVFAIENVLRSVDLEKNISSAVDDPARKMVVFFD